MTAVKDQILKHLESIENEELLNSILDLMQNVNQGGVYQLSSSQKRDIDESIKQIENGEFTNHEDVMKKYIK